MVRYHQEFSTEHPVKGQEVQYRLTMANELSFPITHLAVKFKVVQPGMTSSLPDLHLYLERFGHYEHTSTIHCPYRGVYTVGLEQLTIHDMLRWITVRRPVWHRTFYVYPRILDIRFPFVGSQASEQGAPGNHPGALVDFSLFKGLTGYKHGEPVRHIAWKKFASLGEPFVKNYESTSQPGMTVYFDLRQVGPPSVTSLETEDCSVEILVALVKFLLDRQIPVAVRALGRRRFDFYGAHPSLFHEFDHATSNLVFQHSFSPVGLYAADQEANTLANESVLFITHVLDPDVLTAVRESIGTETSVAAIINLTGMDADARLRARNYMRQIREAGGHLFLVNGPSSIKEDIESWTRQKSFG
jgi:hypothetical protein